MGNRVLVCGGRDFNDRWHAMSFLNGLDPAPSMIIEGGARGADSLGREWAHERGISCRTYPANWNLHGKAAGAIRNQQMLDEARPDLVVAFPGGRGTADMVRRAKAAGVRVIEVTHLSPNTEDRNHG